MPRGIDQVAQQAEHWYLKPKYRGSSPGLELLRSVRRNVNYGTPTLKMIYLVKKKKKYFHYDLILWLYKNFRIIKHFHHANAIVITRINKTRTTVSSHVQQI